MQFRQRPSILTFFTAIFLMFTLAFLTVSLPFVYSAMQMIDVNHGVDGTFAIEENECEDNPFAGTTEEKTPGGIGSVSEEYLHETHSAEEYLAALCKEYKLENYATYIAFYGDLICPPPDIA